MVSTGNEHSRNKPIKLNAVSSEEVGNRLYMKSVCADHDVEKEVDHEKLLTMSLCEEGEQESQYETLVDIIYSEIAAESANNDISPTYSCPALQSASTGQQTMCDLVENDNYNYIHELPTGIEVHPNSAYSPQHRGEYQAPQNNPWNRQQSIADEECYSQLYDEISANDELEIVGVEQMRNSQRSQSADNIGTICTDTESIAIPT